MKKVNSIILNLWIMYSHNIFEGTSFTPIISSWGKRCILGLRESKRQSACLRNQWTCWCYHSLRLQLSLKTSHLGSLICFGIIAYSKLKHTICAWRNEVVGNPIDSGKMVMVFGRVNHQDQFILQVCYIIHFYLPTDDDIAHFDLLRFINYMTCPSLGTE